MHAVRAGNDRRKSLRIEQGLPDLLGRGRNVRFAAAVQRAFVPRLHAFCRTRRRRAFPRMNMRGELRRRERQVDLRKPECVGHRIGEAHWRAHAIPLPHALGPERREWRGRLHVQDHGPRHFHRGRHEIIGERAGEKAAVLRVGVFLVQRRAEPLRKTASHLSRHHTRMQNPAAVVHRDVFVHVHCAGDSVDLDAAEIEDEAMTQRGVDLVRVRRRGQFRRRPEHRLAQGLERSTRRPWSCPFR